MSKLQPLAIDQYKELLEWLPNKEKLLEVVTPAQLRRVLFNGGFTVKDFLKTGLTTAKKPFFHGRVYNDPIVDEKTNSCRYDFSSDDSEGYPRLLHGLINAKYPALRRVKKTVYKDYVFIAMEGTEFSIYLKPLRLLGGSILENGDDVEAGIENQASCHKLKEGETREGNRKNLTILTLNSPEYARLCKALGHYLDIEP